MSVWKDSRILHRVTSVTGEALEHYGSTCHLVRVDLERIIAMSFWPNCCGLLSQVPVFILQKPTTANTDLRHSLSIDQT